jgi:two-component system response regulator MprA
MKKQKTVLVVDDDEMVRKFLFDVLRLQDFDVQTVNDGIAALNLLKASDFDIVITDYAMPGMNGIELTKTIRSRWPHSLIIGISADCDERVFLNAGADAFLHKPFYLHDLLTVIRQKVAC